MRWAPTIVAVFLPLQAFSEAERIEPAISQVRFSTPEEVRTYVKRTIPKDVQCSEMKWNYLSCHKSEGRVSFHLQEQYDLRKLLLGFQFNLMNTSFTSDPAYPRSKEIFAEFIQRHVTPFYESLQLSPDVIETCTKQEKGAVKDRVRMTLKYQEREYYFICIFISENFGYGIGNILLTDFK